MSETKTPATRPWRRRILRGLGALCGALLLVGGVLLADAWNAMGTSADGARLERMKESPRWGGEGFVNPMPMVEPELMEATARWLEGGDHRTPESPPPIERRARADFEAAPEGGLRITWLGHSTMLVELDGHTLLTDPIWGERSSPSSWLGPKRFHAPPLPLEELPELTAVLISHDHYDHLDTPTIEALEARAPRYLVPLGVGAHLEYWGVDPARITEVDWWDEVEIDGLRLVSTPARHFSGRTGFDKDATLWTSWAMIGPEHRVYFCGDTGYFHGFREIGERLGPFDATMLEVGAYNQLWRDVHLGPEQAVRAHGDLRGEVMLPVHWGTFDLALHAWTEPPERLRLAAEREGVRVAIPRPGQSVLPSSPPDVARWWPTQPVQTADEAPVVASHLDERALGAAAVMH